MKISYFGNPLIRIILLQTTWMIHGLAKHWILRIKQEQAADKPQDDKE
jgi:hypothetical protein